MTQTVGGRYELGDPLGRGGMAEVRRAVDLRLGRAVAVKQLRPQIGLSAEEADLAAATWHVLADFQNSPGGSDETIRVYLARDVSAVPAFARHDEEADIETRWVPLDEVVDAVLTRRVQSPSLVVGALAAQASRARGWSTLEPGDEPWLRHPVVGGPPWGPRR